MQKKSEFSNNEMSQIHFFTSLRLKIVSLMLIIVFSIIFYFVPEKITISIIAAIVLVSLLINMNEYSRSNSEQLFGLHYSQK